MANAPLITVTIGAGPSVAIPWAADINAQQALEKAWEAAQDNTRLTYALQYFGPRMGYQVVMVNGTYAMFPDGPKKVARPFYFWEFPHNGFPAPAGIDKTGLQAGDTIRFAYQTYAPGILAGH